MEIHDSYSHLNENIFYILESIPGYSRDKDNCMKINTEMNSQIGVHCNCKESCSISECSCIKVSGGYSYKASGPLAALTFNFVNTCYPVFECNLQCLCLADCGNRLVQYGPSKNLAIKKSDQKGCGIFASNLISKGTFICEYAGEVITKLEALARQKENTASGNMNYIFCLNEYCDGNVTQTFIDPSKFGNIGRYINHSCEPNCVIIPVRINSPVPKLAIFSQSDIQLNEEICFNYGSLNKPELVPEVVEASSMSTRKRCYCQSKGCRGWLPFQTY